MEISGYRQREETVWNRERSLKPGGCRYNLRLYRLGTEGEYIYRLVAQMAGVQGKKQKRVWIDSQTEEEILRGIREAKDLSEYDHLADSAYLRAKEDYLMGINFSPRTDVEIWTICF